jgi:serine/threonine-protein kinase
MAKVYKARCTWLDREVTVKVLRDELVNDEEFVRRFKQEAQAVAKLSHPNIVSVYDVGQEDGLYYMVMEYINGPTLKELIKQKGRLSSEKAIDITIQICAALEHAHENNIIHRDIKPHNILITARGKIKVADFGIARAVADSTVTHPGKIMGSVHYLSPEQARGEVVGVSSDLYSAGAVLYEMLTGRVPFEGESPISVALKHLQEPIESPRKLEPSIPEPVEQVILRALNKDPNLRYTTARVMADALRAASRGEVFEFIPEALGENDGVPESASVEPGETWGDRTQRFERLEKRAARKKKKMRPISWFMVVLGVLGLFTGLVYIGTRLVFVPEVTVPNIQGKLTTDAIRELQTVGLGGVVTGRQFSNEFAKDRVISQKPLPDEIAKQGRNVELIVSQGSQIEIVPNVKGKNITEAGIVLSNRGFKVGSVEEVYDAQTTKGLIISQMPTAEIQQPVGTAINLVVSLGPQPQSISMLNLVGSKLEDAQTQIASLGLLLGSVTEENSNLFFVGQIIRQNPAADSPVIPGATVDLVISKGPGPPPSTAEVKFQVPITGDKHEVVIVVEDLKGIREEYRKNYDPGEQVKVTVRYYGQAKIRVLLDGKEVLEKNY